MSLTSKKLKAYFQKVVVGEMVFGEGRTTEKTLAAFIKKLGLG